MQADESGHYLATLRGKVDEHFSQAQLRQPEEFECTKGCSRCCEQRFSVFEIEARAIRRALVDLDEIDPALRARVRRQADDPEHAHTCALLVDSHCTVYAQRPIICRTHGLPSSRSDGTVDVCPLNFRTARPHPRSLLRLDRINEPLAMIATLDHGSMQASGDTRVHLSELAKGS